MEKKIKVKAIVKTTPKKEKVAKKETTQATAVIKTARKIGGLTVDVYDATGKVASSMELPKEIFGTIVNKRLIAQAVRVFLANQRAGSASTKTRGEVQGSTRKIYRQKGTGRARHGGIRAPIFVHGGIAHGPKPRDFSLKMPKKMKKAALFSSLTDMAKQGAIKIVVGLEDIEPKTKKMAALLDLINPDIKGQKILFVMDNKHDNIARSIRNIEGVTYEYAKQLHTYEILQNKTLIFMQEAIEELKKMAIKKDKSAKRDENVQTTGKKEKK